MKFTAYLGFQSFLIVLVAGLLVCLYLGLRRGLTGLNVGKAKKKQLLFYVISGLVCWLLFLATIAKSGFFTDFQSLPPKIFLAIFPPVLLILYLTFSKSFARLLHQIPPSWLIYVQSFRIVMELFLWMGLLIGVVPFQMTFEGFNFDIIVGITALMAAPLFFGRRRFMRFETIIWNISGLTLLANIVLISLLSTPSPLQVFFNEPANTFVAEIPFIWIPGFVVPFALAMHLFSIRQMVSWNKS